MDRRENSKVYTVGGYHSQELAIKPIGPVEVFYRFLLRPFQQYSNRIRLIGRVEHLPDSYRAMTDIGSTKPVEDGSD